MSVAEGKIVRIPIEKIEPLKENVREMTDEEFNLLCMSIEEDGYIEPIQVVQYGDEPNEKYRIVNGNHRFVALKDVFGVSEIPCIVIGKNWDDEKFWSEVFRLNSIRGDWNKVVAGKKLWELREKLKEKYSDDEIKRKLGFAGDNTLFDKVFKKIKKELPKNLADELEKRKEEIETIEDLSRVIHEIFRRHGETVQQHYLVFTYGGTEHMLIRADSDLWSNLKFLDSEVRRKKLNMVKVLEKLIEKDRIIEVTKDEGTADSES